MKQPKIQIQKFPYRYDGSEKGDKPTAGWVLSTADTIEVHTEDDVLRIVFSENTKNLEVITLLSCAGDLKTTIDHHTGNTNVKITRSTTNWKLANREHNKVLERIVSDALQDLAGLSQESYGTLFRLIKKSLLYKSNRLDES